MSNATELLRRALVDLDDWYGEQSLPDDFQLKEDIRTYLNNCRNNRDYSIPIQKRKPMREQEIHNWGYPVEAVKWILEGVRLAERHHDIG
jgi:hypothetical protein